MQTRHRLYIALLLAGVLAGPAAAQQKPPSYVGKWAVRPELCQAPATPAADQPPPLTLSARKLVTGIMTCDFTSVRAGTGGSKVEANCVAGKEKGRETFTLLREGDVLKWTWNDRTFSFVPCPG